MAGCFRNDITPDWKWAAYLKMFSTYRNSPCEPHPVENCPVAWRHDDLRKLLNILGVPLLWGVQTFLKGWSFLFFFCAFIQFSLKKLLISIVLMFPRTLSRSKNHCSLNKPIFKAKEKGERLTHQDGIIFSNPFLLFLTQVYWAREQHTDHS